MREMGGWDGVAYVVLGTVAISHNCCCFLGFLDGEVGRGSWARKREVDGLKRAVVGRRGRPETNILDVSMQTSVLLQYIPTVVVSLRLVQLTISSQSKCYI